MESEIKEALGFLEKTHHGALATLEEAKPFVSAVSFIYDFPSTGKGWGRVYFFLSELARHTRNLQMNPEVSLLVAEEGPAPAYEKKRVTLQGTIRRFEDQSRFEKLKARYLEIFPAAEMFFGFSDFHFFEMEISEIHWIEGFGKIHTFK